MQGCMWRACQLLRLERFSPCRRAWLGQAVHLPLPCVMGLWPAAWALVPRQQHRALHLKGQVQLKALERRQQEGHLGGGALQAQGLFAPVSS